MLHITKADEDDTKRWLDKQRARAEAKLREANVDRQDVLASEFGWLLCLPKYEGNHLDFDAYQGRFLSVQATRRCVLKCRQVGFSFEIACEALARCHIKEKHVAVCVSYNLDDAKEKISVAKELHEELPLRFQKRMVIDSKTEVGWASNDRKRRVSRIISYPSKAPRGKTGDVYLDELAHCQNDRQIYAGATALIARSKGQMTIGSTPLGRRGIFYAVHTQEWERYPGYWRQEVPWWLCRYFCTDVMRARVRAPSMPTEERVQKFGTAELKDQFDALPLEDFQQEFELAFQDERVSFFPYELILPCCQKERHEIPVHESLEHLADKASSMGPLTAGFDVGRTNHPSELTIFEQRGGVFHLRYQEQFKRTPFPVQRERLKKIQAILGDHLRAFRIDDTGLGKNLAEDLVRGEWGGRVEAVTFTAASKEELANNFKILLQERRIVLPRDRGLIAQIHSVKQKITSAGNAIFDAERNRSHHADRLWSCALACRQKRRKKVVPPRVGVRVIGDREGEGERDEPSLFVEVEEEVRTRASLREFPLEILKDRRLVLGRAARIWERVGDEEKTRAAKREYMRVKREIDRRLA